MASCKGPFFLGLTGSAWRVCIQHSQSCWKFLGLVYSSPLVRGNPLVVRVLINWNMVGESIGVVCLVNVFQIGDIVHAVTKWPRDPNDATRIWYIKRSSICLISDYNAVPLLDKPYIYTLPLLYLHEFPVNMTVTPINSLDEFKKLVSIPTSRLLSVVTDSARSVRRLHQGRLSSSTSGPLGVVPAVRSPPSSKNSQRTTRTRTSNSTK